MWLGRILGTLFGFFIAHFFGAIIGFIIGNAFDKAFSRQQKQGQWQWQQKTSVPNEFFRTTFLVMGHVAKADGRISEDEINMARQIMKRMQLNATQEKQAIFYFNQGKQADFNLQETLNTFYKSAHNQRLLLRMFIEIQFQAAFINGKMNQDKQAILQSICRTLGFATAYSQFAGLYENVFNQQQHQQRYYQPQDRGPSLHEDFQLLGIAANASDVEIKRAYRRAMSQHHPDKLMAQGLPEAMIKLATEKTQQIQAAYERIRQSRG